MQWQLSWAETCVFREVGGPLPGRTVGERWELEDVTTGVISPSSVGSARRFRRVARFCRPAVASYAAPGRAPQAQLVGATGVRLLRGSGNQDRETPLWVEIGDDWRVGGNTLIRSPAWRAKGGKMCRVSPKQIFPDVARPSP
jgi:hypothetical protein